MTAHSCEGVIVTCIDFRFQDYINKWLEVNFAPGSYDRVSIAGGIKDLEYVLNQIEISERLHNIKKAVLINHEDCGAYGDEGSPENHTRDLRAAAEKIARQHPDIAIQIYFAKLDGTFENIGA